jgi:hypothetical protein
MISNHACVGSAGNSRFAALVTTTHAANSRVKRRSSFNRVAGDEVSLDLESRYVPGAVVLNVPVSRDLDCVVLVEDRIEDRLLAVSSRGAD